jgi:hypothetical protein
MVDGSATSTQRLDTNKRGALGGTLAQVYAASQTKHGWLLYNGSASPWVVGVGGKALALSKLLLHVRRPNA